MIVEIAGANGLVWVVDTSEPAGVGTSRGTPYWGHPKTDPSQRVRVHVVPGGDLWTRDREHLHNAFTAGRRPQVAACPFITAPRDYIENFDTYVVYTPAEVDLDREWRAGLLNAEEISNVEVNVSAALGVLHSLGLVHCDVQAGNILRIDGVWKLGDLGGVTRKGRPMRAIQKDRSYVPEGVELGSPAAPENDMFSLDRLLTQIRSA